MFPENTSDHEKLKIVEDKEAKMAELQQLNLHKDILESLVEVKKQNQILKIKDYDLKAAFRSLLKNQDRRKLREVEMLFHTFYEGGSEHCRHQYARHITRLLKESH